MVIFEILILFRPSVRRQIVAFDIMCVNVVANRDVQDRRADRNTILDYFFTRRDLAHCDLVTEWQLNGSVNTFSTNQYLFAYFDGCYGHQHVVARRKLEQARISHGRSIGNSIFHEQTEVNA